MRPTLLRVLTDLYLQRPTHTPEDERYYTELALRLIDASRRLGARRRSRAACTLSVGAARGDRAPGTRRHRGRGSDPRALALPHPGRSQGDRRGARRRSCGDDRRARLASPNRPLTPSRAPADAARAEASELSELFYAAGAAGAPIDPDQSRLCDRSAPSPPVATVQRADVWRLESAALQHNTEAVVRELERTLGVSRAQARRIVKDELGEPIVVAAKAMNLPGRRAAAHAAVHESARRAIGRSRL